ncbi:DEAD/DEAH box helicase family protein [Staphylothermus hellenicus]|uniref:Type III restriction protein res subunit n=1 Tax=Staphylothermus hellenicus (strain DSM 12710 / JCM 10830 / BK20S6-10-b1 / P8) TaxID=591019 RepID=D7DBD9_STAHD|nr:DEAD/DEAH box helicase family protein [Staphylothermus hellenicus]ADI31486.1 type III restriction protein res subunit [Staphylothermus hellenicus DSM 12710]
MTGFNLKVKPRDYQIEAAKWALSNKRSTIVMPTGSGKTLIAVLFSKELLEKKLANKVLVLEPTRILVEQTARYFEKTLGIKALSIHGRYPPEKRIELWRKAKVAAATPETALNDVKQVIQNNYDAIIVDECHHTTGKDAYAKFMKITEKVFKWRLGLSAHIPKSRRHEIERYIGKIRIWSWADERIRKYVPDWIGEIYEAELNDAEKQVLEGLEEARLEYTGKYRGLVNLAIRWFVRDGALALRESLEKETLLASILSHIKPMLENRKVRPLHKLDALKRVLNDHEGFNKAIIFVDRVIVAEYLGKKLMHYNPVIIVGKTRLGTDLREVLRRAHSSETRIVVSTSAGEEGIDLPEADLLIIWSNVASPLRFIQRHGRILRLTGKKGLKFVAYIATPDTPDMDSLLDALELARKNGVDVPIDEETLEALWRRTTRNRILSVLSGKPMPLEWISEITGMPRDLVEKAIKRLEDKGLVIYIYTFLGKTYALVDDLFILKENFEEYLTPDTSLAARIKPYVENKELRMVSGTYNQVITKLIRLLRRYGEFTRISASLQIPLETGALQQIMLHYTFRINNEEVLEAIIRNIYSASKYYRFITKTPWPSNNAEHYGES